MRTILLNFDINISKLRLGITEGIYWLSGNAIVRWMHCSLTHAD
jgi:hypothetical protein